MNQFYECRICGSFRTYEESPQIRPRLGLFLPVSEDPQILHSHMVQCARKEVYKMSDIIKTAGDGANMTPWDYIAMIDRIRKGDYSDLPRIFCVAPSKLIPEMSIEELIEHRHLMENAI